MQEKSFELYQNIVRPELAKLLSLLKLDQVYTRAESNFLFYQKNLQEVKVTDFLGGYGSAILGHNHPEIISCLKKCQERQLPVHSQASLKKETAELAEQLNLSLKKSFSTDDEYVMTLGSTGAEAVEIAIKHALLEWKNKKELLVLKIKTFVIRKRINDADLLKKINKFITDLENMSPLFLSLENSFHGKTSGAVNLTANVHYKKMFQNRSFEVEFLDKTNLKQLQLILEKKQVSCTSTIASFTFSAVAGFIYEPIQGEGGIEEVAKDYLTKVFAELKNKNIPTIADEIQSGMYRTGKFLCSEWFNLVPDYILLGKSLGGGAVKISAALINKKNYVDEFGWIHTSTFAEDEVSSIVAKKALEILNREEAKIAERASGFEEECINFFRSLQKKYPGVIKKIKGRGFFLGIEFDFNNCKTTTDLINGFYEHGHATYLYTSYLLEHHQLRVGVTLSAPETIRLEPSAFIDSHCMSQLFKGFDDLCQVLFERKNLKLLSHLWKQEFTAEQLAIVSDEKYPIEEKKDGEYHVGFLTHIVDERQARQLDKSLVPVAPENIKEFLAKYKNHATPFRYFQKEITSTNGQKVILNLYGIMQSSAFFARSMHAEDFKAFNVVQATVDLATSHQMDFLGLGQFSSIVSENGQLLTSKKLPLTTGNGLTAAMAFEAVKQTCSQRNINLSQAKIAVVGFAGNICNVITQIASDHCQNILLVSRESVESNPKYKLAIELILQNSKIKKENLSYGHSLESLKDRDIIIVGTNSSEEIIKSEMVKSGAIILDISIPSNVESVVKKRSDVVYLQGGLAKLPLAQVVDHPWVPLKTGDCFACMAETILMGFLKENRSYSFGMLNKADVLKTLGFATKTGITLGGLKAF